MVKAHAASHKADRLVNQLFDMCALCSNRCGGRGVVWRLPRAPLLRRERFVVFKNLQPSVHLLDYGTYNRMLHTYVLTDACAHDNGQQAGLGSGKIPYASSQMPTYWAGYRYIGIPGYWEREGLSILWYSECA